VNKEKNTRRIAVKEEQGSCCNMAAFSDTVQVSDPLVQLLQGFCFLKNVFYPVIT
jgi:hypothetical protein